MVEHTTRRAGILTAAAAAVICGALAFGAAPAFADEPEPSAPTQSTAPAGGEEPDRHWRWHRLPAELRADLRELAQAEESERPALRADIREKARGGDYGDRIQQRAERIAELVAALPDDLEADLKATQELAGKERRDAVQAIVDGMLAGDYGPEVQERAQEVADRVENRVERRALALILIGVAAGM